MNKIFFDPKDLSTLKKEISNFDGQIIVIAGPTASGKSSIAIQMATEFGGAIINTDSRQIYKEVTIGTASPIPEKTIKSKLLPSNIWEIEGIHHYLYGYKSIAEQFNVVEFKKDLTEIINKISSKYKKLFLVGGSGLFIDTYIYNYNLDSEPQRENRKIPTRDDLNLLTVEELQKLFTPESLNKLNESDQMNRYRLIRHLERAEKVYTKGTPFKHLYTVLQIGIDEIEKNINTRTEEMIKNGLIEENIMIRKLEKSIGHETIIHKSIGYKEFDLYFEDKQTVEQVKAEINLHSRQYAKRQITWFKRSQ